MQTHSDNYTRMENNSYTNVLDSTKTTGPPVYTCGLCYKDFLYYRDLAVHERMHLEQMNLSTSSLQGGVRPGYDNRQGLYNAPVVPRTTLESFDMLVKPLRGDQDIRIGGQANLRSPVPTSTPQDLDKGAQVYRTEPDSRMVPVDSRAAPVDTRALNIDMRSLPVDNRSLPLDTRAVTLDTRNIQPVDSRPVTVDSRSIPVDSRSLPYSAPSYLDSVNRSIYNTDLTNKIQTSSPTAFQVQPGLRPEEYLDSQVFSKPSDPYYGISKTHYSSLGGVEKAHPEYAPSQFGLSKLLAQTSAPYYPQPLVSQDKEKVPSHSPTTLGYYNQHSISQAEPKPEKRQPSPSPKQTLYYGQPPGPSHPVSMATNSHYQMSLPKPSHLHYPNTRELLNKYPEKPEVTKPYQSGHASAHLTLTDMYKGSQPQSQVFTPVPSQPAPLQPDYSYYKPTSDVGPGANMDSKQANVAALGICECYICFAPFPNMSELSEHMKIHAREDVAMKIAAQEGTQSPQPAPISTNSLSNTYPSVAVKPAVSVSTNSHINTATPSPPSVAFKPVKDSLKIHNVKQQQQYECKTCKKVFAKQAKCSRHEALHQRNIKLFYCEICEKDFSYKGNYLYHVQVVHTKNGADNIVKTNETSVRKTQELDKVVDCQICDEEVVKGQLVNHLKSHTVHTCDKCDRVFVQKTEYVEHLMNDHWRELADSSDAKSGSENSDNERGESNKSERTREQSEEKDSGLEEDHEKDKEEMDNEETTSVTKDIIPESKKKAKVFSEKKLQSKVSVELENLSKKQQEMMAKLKNSSTMVTGKRKKEAATTQEQEAKLAKAKLDDMSLESNSVFLKDTKLKFSCSKCEESFERKTDLALHVETHNRDPSKVYCEVCSMSYGIRDRGYYIYHMKQHTDSELINSKKSEKIRCVVCYVDIRREKYVSHMIKEHTQFSCDLCQWSYSSESSLFNHMKKIHSSGKVKYILKKGGGIEVQHKNVPVVYKKLKDFAPLDKDSDPGSPQGSFKCKFCERIFTKKSSLENHIKKHNAPEQPMICEVCSAAFTAKGAYFYHVLKDHDKLSNSIPQVQNTNTEIADVKAEKELTVLNPETGTFEKTLTEDGKQVEEIKQPCQESSQTAVTNDVTSDKKPSDVVSEIIYCRLCNMCLKRDALFTHIKEHSFFSCDLCKYSFTKKAQYLHHRKMLHVNDIVTEEIERAEAEERLLNKAIEAGKRKRTDLIKLVTCPVCSSEFRQDKYIEHIKAHRKVIMRCRFCGKEFSKKNLHAIHEKSHERISHADNELPFPRNCPVCNIGILSRANYVQHLGEHLKQKPFCCKTCNKQFIGEKILENHKRISHDQNVRVMWMYDGEGMKFDMRTGRYFEVISDYLGEIKELNEIMKANNKPEIWYSTTPKKSKSSNNSISKAQGKKYVEEEALKVEEEEDSEKVNPETSDEDYVPAKKRPYSSASAVDDDDDDDYAPAKKKKKKKRLAFSADDESTSEEEYTNKVTRTRHSSVPLTKKALHRIKHLRTRNKSKMAKKTGKPVRILRSSLPLENKKDSPRQSLKRNAVRDKTPLSDNPETPKRARSTYTPEEIEKYKLKPGDPNPKAGCPLCSIKTSSRGHYEEHLRTHTGEKPFKCVCCDSRFNREWNMWVHVQKMHKDYKIKSPTYTKSPSRVDSSSSKPALNESQSLSDSKSRTRARRSNTMEEPLSSSTPVRSSRLSSRVSTPEPVDGIHAEKTPNSEKNSAAKMKVADKNGSERKQNAGLVCEYCNRQINTKWNYSQHIEWHKKEIKKAELERKPFSCKMCSESFKKKRDLYIHTKVHTGNAIDDEDMMDISKTESDLTDAASVSLHSSVHESDMSFTKDAVDDILGNNSEILSKDLDNKVGNQAAITGNTGSPNVTDVSSTATLTGSSKDNTEDLKNVEKKVQSNLCTKPNNNEHYSNTVADLKDNKINNDKLSETAVVKTPTSTDQPVTCFRPSAAVLCKGNGCENESNSNEGPINEPRSVENTNTASANSDSVGHPSDVKNDSVHRSNNSDVKRLSDSETEESKTKTTKTPPPVKKMSSDTALSKWKMKVKATLSSQLELNAAKKEEEMANPETAKLKEMLAIKGTMEKKKNFECRICGEAFDLESGFRDHMDVHFNESPPYCGICDIYFMAIYPKRRLMEHNKKKHPELQS